MNENFFYEFISAWAKNFQKICENLPGESGVPYLKECELDGPRGPRKITKFPSGGYSSSTGDLLPGSVDNSPDCYLNVSNALQLLEGHLIKGIYAHIPSMNLVFVTEAGGKIGVRSTCLNKETISFIKNRLLENYIN